jgi:hypothetical protein
MLARYVQVTRGPLIVDVSNTYRRLRPGEFTTAYAHCKVVGEKSVVPVTGLWAQSERRMTADCLGFHPGQPQLYDELGLRHLNLWAPPQWPPTDVAAAAPFTAHLEYLIPDQKSRDDLLDWLAHAAQEPQVRPHHHFLLVAAKHEGTGRSWIADLLVRLWGERHATAVDLHSLINDNFNSILSGKIITAVHEVMAPPDERHGHRDRLKSLLTDATLTVNEKHLVRWTERFCARFLMFTNAENALPLSERDRRIYAIRCTDTLQNESYYRELYARLADGHFLAAVWSLLRTRSLHDFNPGRRPPLNEMKAAVIAAGRSDEQQTAVEFALACPYDVISSVDLMKVVAPKLDEEPERDTRARRNAVTAALREAGMQTSAKKVSIDGNATRVWILKDATRWASATGAALRQEAEMARKDINAGSSLVDDIIAMWRGTTR